MRLTLKTTIVAGVLAVGGLLAMTSLAQAGGCCGSAYRGGGTFGRTYAAPSYGGGSCCNMAGMNMAAMPMGSMPMPAAQAPGASMQGMNMGGYAAPAPAAQPTTATAAGSQYFCPMHPNVVSTGPATCPYCHMALKKR